MRSNIVSEASISTRASQWWVSIPFVTSSVVAICATIYCVDLLTGYDSFQGVCISPTTIVSQWQIYRIFTSTLFHNGILHIVFNMLAFVPMGSALERQLASMRYFFLLVLFATSNAVFNIAVAVVAAYNPFFSYPKLMIECGIGFSGIIFALIVVETYTSGAQNHSVFGFFSVPAKWYPWALLILFQFLMPNVSLIGHLSGILSGIAYCQGYFKPFMPSSSLVSFVESSAILSPVVHRPNFMVGGSSSATAAIPIFSNSTSAPLLSQSWQNLKSLFSRQLSALSPRGSQRGSTDSNVDQRFPGQGSMIGSHPSSSSQAGPSNVGSRIVTLGSVSTSQNDSPTSNTPSGKIVGGQSVAPNVGPAEAAAIAAASRAAKLGYAPQPQAARIAPQQESRSEHSRQTMQAPSQTELGTSKEFVDKLLAMGFEKSAALRALGEANGDLAQAVELLSEV